MTPLTMVPVMLSNGFMFPSIAGLVVYETPCAPVPETHEVRAIILRRDLSEKPCAAGDSATFELQPKATSAAGFVDVGELTCMRLDFVTARAYHRNRAGPSYPRCATQIAGGRRGSAGAAEFQHRLATSHRQVHVCENLGIEKRAVKLARRVVDLVALAQRIKAVALPRMKLPRQRETVENPAVAFHPQIRVPEPCEFVIEERYVEWGVVNDDLCARDEFQNVRVNIRESGFVLQKLASDAMHVKCTVVNLAVWLKVVVESLPGQATIHQLDNSNLNDSMSQLGFETRRFGIENHLSHVVRTSTADRASASAFSLPSSPA